MLQYWTHVDGPAIELFDGKNPVTNASCTSYGSNINTCPVQYYSADLFTERACDIITTVAAQGDPLFLYLAYQSVSCGLCGDWCGRTSVDAWMGLCCVCRCVGRRVNACL